METNIARQGFYAIAEICMQFIMWQLKKLSTCIYSFMTFLMNYVTYLNNTYGLKKKKNLNNTYRIFFLAAMSVE